MAQREQVVRLCGLGKYPEALHELSVLMKSSGDAEGAWVWEMQGYLQLELAHFTAAETSLNTAMARGKSIWWVGGWVGGKMRRGEKEREGEWEEERGEGDFEVCTIMSARFPAVRCV